MSVARRQDLVALDRGGLSVVRQCELLGISRSGFYYEPSGESETNLRLMRLIDGQFMETPFYGSRQMMRHLHRLGEAISRDRVRRLMRLMGLAVVYGGAVAAEPKVRFSAKPLSVVRVPGRTDEKPLQIRAPLPRMQKHGWRGYLAVDRCTSLCWLADTNTRDHPGNCFSHIKRRFSAENRAP